MSGPQTLILGAGHAGVQTAAALRAKGHTARLVLIDQQAALPYERPPLSKDVLVKDVPSPLLRKEAFYAERGIELLRGVATESIDRAASVVRMADGRSIGYERLVLATGSLPRALPVPGAGLEGVVTLRTERDALRIRDGLRAGARLVVIGAGYVGLEVAAAAVSRGAEVTVLEREPRVLARVASPEVSSRVRSLHESHGVRFLMECGVTAIEGDGRVRRVLTTQGRAIDADLVVAGIGVVAADELARAAGLACDNGILVDEDCRTSDPSVHAIGDVARFHHPLLGAQVRLECIANAMAQADRVAEALLGRERTPYDIPWFWSVQYDARLQSVGFWQDGSDTVVRGAPAQGRFSVLHLRGPRLAAIETMGMGGDFIAARKLIRSGASLRRDSLADASIPLSSLALTEDTPCPN
ncbi:FAD-dependent oxidoreductase [Hydrogenophaga sp.]|uniref:NAD(P)/FAD-dependent oxidoreductase n=1 Tax=Hydrogenophaga sp. TaxID=1904254 RepID=UPI002616F129|nr:FAD-dependent oxidoreductase [Hydrogenophaga sp.]MCW5653024.1 FAD-dependent oxidoreductase [Hydrogenophaga sp.]